MTQNIKVWALAIAIAIVFNLFIHAGLSTFYPGPQYEDFCEERPRAVIEQLNDSEINKLDAIDQSCWREFDNAREPYQRNSFIIQVILSVIVLGAGIALRKQAVAGGLMLGGVLGLFIATMMYWDNFPDLARFVILGVLLTILIWVGYKKVK